MFPKKGNYFPNATERSDAEQNYARAIASALKEDLGETHQAVKIVMRWTGANERTVKNWLTGRHGPSGEHLMALVRNSDLTLEVFLRLAGREHALAVPKLFDVRTRLNDLLVHLDLILDKPS